MGWDFCESKHIKTKKEHKCAFCSREIPKGTLDILHWHGMFEGDFQNSYACNWCEDHQSHLIDDSDNEILDFGDCLREDIFQDELDELEKSTYFKGEGDYFVFRSHETDKELLKIKCPISREHE